MKLCLDSFSRKIQILNFTKIRPVIAELFHADRPADGHDEANSHFSQFVNAPKNGLFRADYCLYFTVCVYS
jgi:hypothetical protein